MKYLKLNTAAYTFSFTFLLAGYVAAGVDAVGVYVDTYATGGTGTSSAPWTGWDTTAPWAPGKVFIFRAGYYAFSSTPSSWSQDNMILEGTPATVLKYNGTALGGAVVSFNGGTTGYNGVVFENFIIDGNGKAGDGLYINNVHRSRFDNIRIRNVTANGFNLAFNVLNTFTNPRVSEPTGTTSAMPSTAINIGAQPGNSANFSNSNTITNPIIENIPGATGINLVSGSSQTLVTGGTFEGLGTGISMCTDGTGCSKNIFTGTDLEANTVADLVIGSTGSSVSAHTNQFNNVMCISNPSSGAANVVLTSSAVNNQFIGGQYSKILERGQNNSFMNILTAWSNIDSYRVKTAFINVRDPGDGSSRTLLPLNTSIGQSDKFTQNSFVTTASLTFSPTSASGISEQSVGVSGFMQVGDVATVSYVDNNSPHVAPPSNFTLSAYVDPSNPYNVVVRWTQIGGTGATPPAGTYKVAVTQ